MAKCDSTVLAAGNDRCTKLHEGTEQVGQHGVALQSGRVRNQAENRREFSRREFTIYNLKSVSRQFADIVGSLGVKSGDYVKSNENAAKNQNRVQYGRWIVDEFNSPAEGKGGQLVDIADDLNWHSVWATAVCSVEPVEQVKFSGKLELL